MHLVWESDRCHDRLTWLLFWWWLAALGLWHALRLCLCVSVCASVGALSLGPGHQAEACGGAGAGRLQNFSQCGTQGCLLFFRCQRQTEITQQFNKPKSMQDKMVKTLVRCRRPAHAKAQSLLYGENLPDMCLQLELPLLKRMFFKRKACKETHIQQTNFQNDNPCGNILHLCLCLYSVVQSHSLLSQTMVCIPH